MNSYPTLRRWLAAGVTGAVLMGVAAFAALSNREVQKDDPPKVDKNYPWPLFGGSLNRNLVNLVDKDIPIDFNLDTDDNGTVELKNTKHVKWFASLGSLSYGGPVVAEGKVFVGTNNENPRDPAIKGDKGILQCFDEANGKFLWQKVFNKLPAGFVNDWPEQGICSTPVIEKGKMYYVSNRGEVVRADANTGEVEKSLNMMTELGVFQHNLATCSPLIVGDLIFVCTSNGVDEGHINVPQPKAPSFIAVDKKSLKLKWQNNDPTKNLLKPPPKGDKKAFIKQLINAGELIMHGQWANPAYADIKGVPQVIFPGGDGWLYAFDPPTGKVIWKFDCNPKKAVYELEGKGTRNDFVNTPVIYDNKLYIGVGQDPEHREGVGHYWCVDLVKATELGPKNKGNDVSPKNDIFDAKDPVNKDSALVWHYGDVGAAKDRPAGSKYVFGRTMSTASIHEGLLYIAELSGYLHCLDAKTGVRQWYHNTQAPIWSSPYYCDGKIFLGNDDKVLYVFKAGAKKELLAEIDMLGKVRATPVVANGTLYVMTDNALYAIAKK